MMIGAAAVAVGALLPMTAQARSMLYYYDFDTIENGSLVYTNSTDHANINKGSGTAEFHKSANSPEIIPYTTEGAFSSSGAFYANSKGTIWLGDGSKSLGCSTVQGFTLSFWLKSTSSHTAWRNFLGFTVGGENYRLEYESQDSSDFSIWRPTSNNSSECVSTNDVTRSRSITQATAGEWKHVAFVFAPGTNSLGLCAIYVGGEKVGSMKVVSAGSLSRVCVGPLVAAWNNAERNASSSGNDTKTGIDELAVFDYPATAEQVKWLAKYRPAQPANDTVRAMPIAWLFDSTSTTHGVVAGDNGNGTLSASLWGGNDPKATANANGALGSAYCMEVNNKATWRVADSSSIGASIGSGYTISFWLKAPSKPTAWKDFFYYGIGGMPSSGGEDWGTRFEFNSDTPAKIGAFGSGLEKNYCDRGLETVDTWQHVCLVWNSADKKVDWYFGGVKKTQMAFSAEPSVTDAVSSIMVGTQSYGDDKKWRSQGGCSGVYVDELAFFNHSLSPDQIAWLGTHVPALPPLDATNLVRTVSADCSWAGGLASWGVKEWNGEAWADTTRTTIYPALEDTEVETAVAFASGATITNDTFVTPKRLSLSNASGGASVAPTLVCAEGSLFAPESMEIGDGVTLNVSAPFGDPVSAGTLTFGEGAKIVFDSEVLLASDPDEKEWKKVMTFGSVVLPSGEANVLSHFGVSNGKYALKLSDDGKSVLAKRTRGSIITFF